MDINKILSEQLNLNALNPFTTTNVEGVNDNAENSEMSVNPDVAEVSDALKSKDEDATLSFDNIDLAKLNKSAKNINSMMNFMSNQVQNQENKEKQIEEEISKKQEEYQKLAEDIQEKQEEYESLVQQAESEQDKSIAEQATALGEEINSMVNNLESIKTSIDNLETNLKTQQNLTSTLKQTSQTMSKVQTQISKEVAQANAVSQTQATNQVSATDAVGKTDKVTQIVESVAYTKTETQKDGKVVTTSYGASGRPISATSTDKDGVARDITYQYNSDGSYTKTTINKKTDVTTTASYDASGKLTRKELDYIDKALTSKWKDRFGRIHGDTYKTKEIYEYNDDGSYQKWWIQDKYSAATGELCKKDTRVSLYDKNGKKIKGDPNAKIVNLSEHKYWEKLNENNKRSNTLKYDGYCDDWKDYVKNDGSTIVIFGKGGCGACVNIRKDVVNMAQAFDAADINIVYLDVDCTNRSEAYDDIFDIDEKLSPIGKNQKANGLGVPYIVKFDNGEPVARISKSAFEETCDQALGEVLKPNNDILDPYNKAIYNSEAPSLESIREKALKFADRSKSVIQVDTINTYLEYVKLQDEVLYKKLYELIEKQDWELVKEENYRPYYTFDFSSIKEEFFEIWDKHVASKK